MQATLLIGCEHLHHSEREVRLCNSVACSDHVVGFQGCYDKRYLVPAAETASVRDAEGPFYVPGQNVEVFLATTPQGAYRFGTAICYDLCFGAHFRDLLGAEQTVDFFVQCGAEGQDRDQVVADRMLRFARLRAVESRRPLVRNVTLGHSALIDGNGVVREALPPEPLTEPYWLGAIPLDGRRSFYAVYGDWIAQLSCSAVAIMTLLSLQYAKKSHLT